MTRTESDRLAKFYIFNSERHRAAASMQRPGGGGPVKASSRAIVKVEAFKSAVRQVAAVREGQYVGKGQ